MALTPDEVRKVGTLARLALSEDEIDRFTHQINDLLEQFARLQELDTEAVEPTSHAVPVAALLREDVVRPSLPREAVLAMGPKVDPWMGGFIVPQVIGESQ
ncbi:MAG TPA: Asp-tRNA(Asn)/Glu-tRNA(Gln) amidotransferase subunit GatC [Armatimonadaceae bacterium]|jgi:aspartyl-tRNA(Asn)/glutamyl-tRNA(Gln) amidotransferase subunit C|nr:Asp-tRNA(Asn)/Glu-tRNA(Gln) amidotransferase subunit GatC [Armatimonadaceae bacterium]